MAKQRKYTKEFKLEALRLYETSHKSITEIEQDLGITPGMMNKWRRRYQTEGEQAFRGKGRQDDSAAELRRLQREVEVLRQEYDISKKSHSALQQGRAMKYQFIASHRHEYDVKIMCRVLEVSVSGYYAWRHRAPNARQQADGALVEHIRDVHVQSRRTYGSPRVHAALRLMGIRCSRKRVARLMRLHGLRGCDRRRSRPWGTDSQHNYPVATNTLARDFTARVPNQKWLADVSYIDTQEGFLYLAALEDVCSRKIIGWAMGVQPTAALVEQALAMAVTRRQPSAGVLHHSDRGSQYASETYRRLLIEHHLSMSMSRKGNCYDNAMMESFFATLKTECATSVFPSRAAARTAIFEFIEVFYNRQRLHSALGYVSPEAFERQFKRTFL